MYIHFDLNSTIFGFSIIIKMIFYVLYTYFVRVRAIIYLSAYESVYMMLNLLKASYVLHTL